MCGRIVHTLPVEAMTRLFKAVPSNDMPPGPNYNVCPTDQVAVVTSDDGQRRLRPMRWGLIPPWYKTASDGPLLINARAETIAEKPAFHTAARERRCLIPATGFYEWTKGDDGARLPWYIRSRDQAPLALAGIWQDWDKGAAALTTCAVVTTEANRAMSALHHRMPVMLGRDDWPLWLGEAGPGAARLMVPADDDLLAFHRVDPRVNSNRASGADLIGPLAA